MQTNRHQTYLIRLTLTLLTALMLFAGSSALAQSNLPKFEAGAQLSIIDMRESIVEKPLGIGGRFSYNVTDLLAVDTEVTYFSTAEVDLNRTQGLFGVKAGRRFGGPSVGVFAKVRPGFMRFHGERRPGVTIDGTTKFALDLGGVIELYPSARILVRIDVGDTVIFYNDETVRKLSLPGGPPQQLGTSHNLQTSIGIGFRF